jgi:hypothetical protein
MKRFIVDQSANVEVTLTRTFLLEVPDDCTQEEAEKLLLEIDESALFEQQVEWINDGPCEWDEVDAQGTTLTPLSSDHRTDGLPIISLDNEE